MMKYAVSVILPVYNVEEYLPKCMQSLFSQTFSDFEIIIIDDGSNETCSRLCDSYKEHPGVAVYHKKNGGLSDARNYGIEHASGDWIIFIDPDDYVDPDHIEYLVSLSDRYGTDMAISQHRDLFPDGRVKDFGAEGEECLDDKTCIERMLYHDVIDTSAWGKMYRKTLFKEIRYPVGLCFEDIGTTYALMMEAGKIAVGYRSTYNYIYRPNSIVTGAFNPHKIDMLKNTDKMARDVLSVYPDLKDAVIRRRVYARFSTLNQMENAVGYDALKKDIIAFIKKYSKNVLRNPRTPKRDRLAIRLLLVNYDLYRSVWGARSRLLHLKGGSKPAGRDEGAGRAEMTKLDTDGIKAIEKDLLAVFDKICSDNDLYYTLCGGTLLGCIRHKGFIPWDDDIDVLMPRPDYDRLLHGEVDLGSLPDHVKVVKWTDGSMNFPFIKLVDTRTDISVEFFDDRYNVRHIWIDIFPIDGNSGDPDKCADMCRRIHFLRHILTLKLSQSGEGKSRFKAALKPFVKAILTPIPIMALCKRIDDISKSYPFDYDETICGYLWGYGTMEVIHREPYMIPLMKEFEGDLYPVPSNYDEYLSNLYGDYMQLPPEEKRVFHGITAYIKKNSEERI